MFGEIFLKESWHLDFDVINLRLVEMWQLKATLFDSQQNCLTLGISDFEIKVQMLPEPLVKDSIERVVIDSYFWPNAKHDLNDHHAHILVAISVKPDPLTVDGVISYFHASLFSDEPLVDAVSMNTLFTQVVSTLLECTKAIGVFIECRHLLLPAQFYIEIAERSSNNNLPLHAWIYFGARSTDGKQSIFTRGMSDFQKPEMEIIESLLPIDDLTDLMFNLTHYLILNDVTLKNGETIGMSAEQKLSISYSQGKYLPGETLKIVI
jgi:hypothetical protein